VKEGWECEEEGCVEEGSGGWQAELSLCEREAGLWPAALVACCTDSVVELHGLLPSGAAWRAAG